MIDDAPQPLTIGKHLSNVLRNLTHDGTNGICLHLSVACVMDRAASRFAIGTLRNVSDDEIASFGYPIDHPAIAREPFIHAWVEEHGDVISPSKIAECGGLYPFDRTLYYDGNGVREVRYLTRARVLSFARAGHLAAYFAQVRPDHCFAQTFGEALMEFAGHPYRRDAGGFAMPLEMAA